MDRRDLKYMANEFSKVAHASNLLANLNKSQFPRFSRGGSRFSLTAIEARYLFCVEQKSAVLKRETKLGR
ncbi:MAG: hypothetical protein ACI9G1_005088 [Pirellulaceae bacterium]|jgi:hypothetical protein